MYLTMIVLALAFTGAVLQLKWSSSKLKVPVDTQIGRTVAVLVLVCMIIVLAVINLTCNVINGMDSFADYIILPTAIIWLGLKVLHLHMLIKAKVNEDK